MPAPIVINDADALRATLVPTRKLLYMVLLLAVKDRATEVRFEPSPEAGQWKLTYKTLSGWHEMVPPSIHLPVSREAKGLVGLGRRVLYTLLRRPSLEGQVCFRIGGKLVPTQVSVKRSADRRQSVRWQLPECPDASGDARRILAAYIGKIPSQSETLT